jgi:hypothetical protein
MTTEIPRYRCGYCSSPGSDYGTGRCRVCGSALYDCHRALKGAHHEEYLRRALKQLDRQLQLVRDMSGELRARRMDDLRNGLDPGRFKLEES